MKGRETPPNNPLQRTGTLKVGRAGSHRQGSSDRGFFPRFRRQSLLEQLNLVRKGLVKRGDWRWPSYNNFALEKAGVAACPTQIDDVRLPLGHRA